MNIKPGPIGIFDSGLGGLTVLKSLCSRLENESFIYLGDIARLPYGNKSPETVRKYGEQIMERLIKEGATQLVIACNTASTVFLGEKEFKGFPLYNVIEPGSEAAIAASKSKVIGVIGTRTTIQSHAYKTTLHLMDSKVLVEERACPLFVPLAEEGFRNDSITQSVASRYLDQMPKNMDTLILGCTHYPIIKEDIQRAVGEQVRLIESGDVLALKLKNTNPQNSKTIIRILATDLTSQFETLAKELLSPFKADSLEKIDL